MNSPPDYASTKGEWRLPETLAAGQRNLGAIQYGFDRDAARNLIEYAFIILTEDEEPL
ncbi:hypothetical protein NOC27_1166 [Nitrosococcus oceani AFC27]|uniref:hypothetical protein n=1 Tax=Nitrosococcus oceani TaxID=1229 RepID=UPI000183C6B8|nr:hypothetical protein [Nitrosococcus oceani]EDZ67839.1 hypothetical protein NOC27_1166 [Nitrosococcus oceani AFC27]